MGSPVIAKIALILALLDPILQLDGAVQGAVQRMRPSILDGPMRIATDVGKPQNVLGALLIVAISGGAAGPETARRAVLALVPTNLVVEISKRAVHRRRPDGESRPSNASFPSSHAANAFALAMVLRPRWRRWVPLFFALAATVAFSRVYLNRHFLTDVLAGAIVGVGCGWLANNHLRWPAFARSSRMAQSSRGDEELSL